MKFINPLPFVADINKAKKFYQEVMQLNVIEDHGNFVRFENGFALHDAASLHYSVFGNNVPQSEPFGRQNLVLYFEVDDLDAAFERSQTLVDMIHPIQCQDWGQRVFRFHDPDGHIVEIGEPQ